MRVEGRETGEPRLRSHVSGAPIGSGSSRAQPRRNLTLCSDGKLIVQCTNRGVPFVEAVAGCNIGILGNITFQDPAMLSKLVHTDSAAKNIFEIPLLTVQVTRFKCGGFVMGMTINHCMVDGISAMEFV
ncbi:hypothetical protein POM88_006008 [Heracleum sosnowskyi]|uniref:Uncharacterized protein n=1 Tax=Heracleum sosnowskyi TaxID=360622 RepID=A0AAD8J5J0_9APIA|nr:hypothetical protein POM88_006008 [Heracleum sosnowskyi]